MLLVSLIAIGYRAPQEVSGVANVAPTTLDQTEIDDTAVNEVIATNIAAGVASAANLSIAPNVSELAISTEIQNKLAQVDGTSAITKPQILELSSVSRKISRYTVESGDSVGSVATRFGLSKQTIRWANDLTSDELIPGTKLDILPRDGIVYVVRSGDTLASIAKKYKADATIITTYNDLEIGGIKTGLKIIIPDGILPEDERPGYVNPATMAFITGYSSGWSSGRTWYIKPGIGIAGKYAWGNCTSYAFYRRAQLGRPIGDMWGNAGAWATNARAAGFTVNSKPAAGAVIQDWGHVAIVEKVLPNGDLELSEMNASVPGGGLNIVSGRILPAAEVGQYLYIH